MLVALPLCVVTVTGTEVPGRITGAIATILFVVVCPGAHHEKMAAGALPNFTEPVQPRLCPIMVIGVPGVPDDGEIEVIPGCSVPPGALGVPDMMLSTTNPTFAGDGLLIASVAAVKG